MGGGDPVIALLVAAVLAAWAVMGALAVLAVLAAGKLARRGRGDMEALIEATREEPSDAEIATWIDRWEYLK